MKQKLTCLLLILFLASCQNAEGTSSDETSNPIAACKSDALQHLIGKPETVLENENIVASRNMRILRSDSVATQDYIESRTNIIIDANGNVSDITCG